MEAWFSFEFGATARRADGRRNGAAKPATALVWRNRRRESGRADAGFNSKLVIRPFFIRAASVTQARANSSEFFSRLRCRSQLAHRISQCSQHLRRKRARSGFGREPRTSDIERSDFMPLDELAEFYHRFIPFSFLREVQAGLAMFDRQVTGERRAAGQCGCDRENHRAVGIADVPFGTLRVGCVGRFLQFVSRPDCAVLGQPSAWTPAAVRDAVLNGDIQRRPVHAALAAGDDSRNGRVRSWRTRHCRALCRSVRDRIQLAFVRHGSRLTTRNQYGH